MPYHPYYFGCSGRRVQKLRTNLCCFLLTLLPPYGQDIKVTMVKQQKAVYCEGTLLWNTVYCYLRTKLLLYTLFIRLERFLALGHINLLPNLTQRAKGSP